MKINQDKIINFYKNIDSFPRACFDKNVLYAADKIILKNHESGLGDSLSCFIFDDLSLLSKSYAIEISSFMAKELRPFNRFIFDLNEPCQSDAYYFNIYFAHFHDCGLNGHLLQKIQKVLDLEVQIKPRPKIESQIKTKNKKVVLSFDYGRNDFQFQFHERPRVLYEETRETIQKFILKHKNEYEFVEVGKKTFNFEGVENKTNLGIYKTALEIASCEFFFGMHNGLMHLAAGFNKPSIVLINFPDASKICLPKFKDLGLTELDWLYPQNIHLHQDGEGEFVKKSTLQNIEKAFAGDLYPYFRDDYLDLIFNY